MNVATYLLAAGILFSYAQAQMDPTMVRTRPSGPFPATDNITRWHPLPAAGGPFLRFSGRNGDILTYSVMVFVATDPVTALVGTNLRITPSTPLTITSSKPTILFSFHGYTFIRWVVKVKLNSLINTKSYIAYTVSAANGLLARTSNTFALGATGTTRAMDSMTSPRHLWEESNPSGPTLSPSRPPIPSTS